MTPRYLNADLAAELRDELASRDFYTATSRVAVRARGNTVELEIGDADGPAHSVELDVHTVDALLEMLMLAKLGLHPA